jgi:hypothetical protein
MTCSESAQVFAITALVSHTSRARNATQAYRHSVLVFAFPGQPDANHAWGSRPPTTQLPIVPLPPAKDSLLPQIHNPVLHSLITPTQSHPFSYVSIPSTSFTLFSAVANAALSISMPIQFKPKPACNPATSVVPEPIMGSNRLPPFGHNAWM